MEDDAEEYALIGGPIDVEIEVLEENVVVNEDVDIMCDNNLDLHDPQEVRKEQAFANANANVNAGATANYLLTYQLTEGD